MQGLDTLNIDVYFYGGELLRIISMVSTRPPLFTDPTVAT